MLMSPLGTCLRILRTLDGGSKRGSSPAHAFLPIRKGTWSTVMMQCTEEGLIWPRRALVDNGTVSRNPNVSLLSSASRTIIRASWEHVVLTTDVAREHGLEGRRKHA